MNICYVNNLVLCFFRRIQFIDTYTFTYKIPSAILYISLLCFSKEILIRNQSISIFFASVVISNRTFQVVFKKYNFHKPITTDKNRYDYYSCSTSVTNYIVTNNFFFNICSLKSVKNESSSSEFGFRKLGRRSSKYIKKKKENCFPFSHVRTRFEHYDYSTHIRHRRISAALTSTGENFLK